MIIDGYNIVWYTENTILSDTDVITADIVSTSNSPKSRSPKYINCGAGFDCETSRSEYLHKPKTPDKSALQRYKESLYSYVYIWQCAIGKTIYLCRDYNLFGSFLEKFDSLCDCKGDKTELIVWIANINYEFTYFQHIFMKNIHDVFAKDTHCICSFKYGNHLYFRECLGVFGSSLEKIAKNHTKTQKLKGDLDYDKPRHSLTPLDTDELHYCINDVAILSELTSVAHEMYTLQGKKIPLTQTGIVRDEIKRAYLSKGFTRIKKLEDENLKLIGTQKEYNEFRRYLYSGGLTHSNFKYVGKLLNNITCYDLTSAYPWALNSKYYPAGELKHCDNYPRETLLKYLQGNRSKCKHIIAKIQINGICSKSTHSTISKHKVLNSVNAVIDNGRIYKADIISLWVNEVDFANICAIYKAKSWNLLDLYYFTASKRVDKEMLSTMNSWYIKKAILKEEMKQYDKHSTEYIERKKTYDTLKQLINSVYGMCVTQLYDTEYILNVEGNIKENVLQWDEYNKTMFNPYIGYWCTAYVRQRLIHMISKFPDYVVQYDTDSIYCLPSDELKNEVDTVNKQIAQEIKNSPCCTDVHTHDLGQWDFDGFYTEYLPMGSKRYAGLYTDGTCKITFAGAPIKQLEKMVDKTKSLMCLTRIAITDDVSTKKGAYNYYNIEHTATYTDYMGNTHTMTTYGCKTIINVDFNATLSESYSAMQKLFA